MKPGDTRTTRVDDVELVEASVGHMDNNAYLLARAGVGILIDAAAEPERLLALIDERCPAGLPLIITTHRHADHVGALGEVARATGARVVAGADDAADIARQAGIDVAPVHAGDALGIPGVSLDVIPLVGHTPGGIALVWRPSGPVRLFTGDSLFPGGPGKTTSPRDFASLMDDLESRIFDVFDDDAIVYPGHGDDTTLGAERPHLDEWRARGW